MRAEPRDKQTSYGTMAGPRVTSHQLSRLGELYLFGAENRSTEAGLTRKLATFEMSFVISSEFKREKMGRNHRDDDASPTLT